MKEEDPGEGQGSRQLCGRQRSSASDVTVVKGLKQTAEPRKGEGNDCLEKTSTSKLGTAVTDCRCLYATCPLSFSVVSLTEEGLLARVEPPPHMPCSALLRGLIQSPGRIVATSTVFNQTQLFRNATSY
ncbi:hypothetical protein SKAU_G00054920 [Synaphobranchus kaupii]|uniref:Uncharacterized protein n=1 Tax=Synaphobranchus kaupii TaxID=118154 RepID=A0A9Q1JA55_SYNKA|nr:hypothetical protein SKAU_G00054920 [Synaphobranchus kaupii]